MKSNKMVLLRSTGYPFVAAFFLWVCGGYDLGIDSAVALSMFALFMAAVELIIDHQAQKGIRYFCYCLCVLGLYFTGLNLLTQAVECKSCTAARAAHHSK